MKIIISKKYAKEKEPKYEILEKNKVSLTGEERKEVMDRGVVWHHGPNGEETPAVWKAEVDGKMWYICATHRCCSVKPTLKGAINSYDFIETTANNREKIIISKKYKINGQDWWLRSAIKSAKRFTELNKDLNRERE